MDVIKNEDNQNEIVQSAEPAVKILNSSATVQQKQPLRFLRIKQLLRDIQDPNIQMGAILGAGISVSAGFSAFRSDNSVFAKMSQDYTSWPHRDDSEDSFLGYAFSVSALRNDPRVQYRVLHRFDLSTHQVAIYPTKAHAFLQYLAEQKKLTRCLTQNIDDLEVDVGLEHLLKENLIQAHGSFSKPPLCVNMNCPSVAFIKEAREEGNLVPDKKRELALGLLKLYSDLVPQQSQSGKYDPHRTQAVLELQEDFLRAHPQIFLSALYDDAVPCCPYCGICLKPSMVLYEEEINLPTERQKSLFLNCKSLLIIGTSLNVEPVNHLPAYMTSDSSIHVIAKEVNFQKYFTEFLDDQSVLQLILQRRIDRVRYKSCDEQKQELIKYLVGDQPTIDNKVFNLLTPLFNYHMGESDQLVEDLLEYLPEAKIRVDQIREQVIKNSKRTRQKPNYDLDLENLHIKYKYVEKQSKLQLVLLAIPMLWPPDAAIYFLEKQQCYTISVLMMPEQIQLIKKIFIANLIEEKTELNGNPAILFLDKRTTQENLDKFVYMPIGGHWSISFVAYNQYGFEGNGYREELDPWSYNFIGYQQKRIYFKKHNDFFCYQGVWRNFHYMLKQTQYQMTIKIRATQHVLLGEDYDKVIKPVFFNQWEQLCDV
ncbi:Sir2_family protein [Hexamita inflata]|uniref:Sir2 family protein n=1 Tax=Hexamita inflata TaxID=28002 RepID=A0AA86UG48_9EUKA|nr:Sir2 family protein [Hexamita inflata]